MTKKFTEIWTESRYKIRCTDAVIVFYLQCFLDDFDWAWNFFLVDLAGQANFIKAAGRILLPI